MPLPLALLPSLVFTSPPLRLFTLRGPGVRASNPCARTRLIHFLHLVWTADHDLEDGAEGQIDVYTGRGIVSESTNGPVWLIGTGSEHAAIVQYSFVNSKNVYAGLIQTETVSFKRHNAYLTRRLCLTYVALLPTFTRSPLPFLYLHDL